jgi:hypothetical protein
LHQPKIGGQRSTAQRILSLRGRFTEPAWRSAIVELVESADPGALDRQASPDGAMFLRKLAAEEGLLQSIDRILQPMSAVLLSELLSIEPLDLRMLEHAASAWKSLSLTLARTSEKLADERGPQAARYAEPLSRLADGFQALAERAAEVLKPETSSGWPTRAPEKVGDLRSALASSASEVRIYLELRGLLETERRAGEGGPEILVTPAAEHVLPPAAAPVPDQAPQAA